MDLANRSPSLSAPTASLYLCVDIHLARLQQHGHNLQAPQLGGVVEAGVAVLLLGRTKRHQKPTCSALPRRRRVRAETYDVVDAGAVLDEVARHLDVIVDDGLQQRRPQLFVLGVHFGARLEVQQR